MKKIYNFLASHKEETYLVFVNLFSKILVPNVIGQR